MEADRHSYNFKEAYPELFEERLESYKLVESWNSFDVYKLERKRVTLVDFFNSTSSQNPKTVNQFILSSGSGGGTRTLTRGFRPAMQADRRLKRLAYVQFVMGVENAVPADRDVFDYYTRTVEQFAQE